MNSVIQKGQVDSRCLITGNLFQNKQNISFLYRGKNFELFGEEQLKKFDEFSRQIIDSPQVHYFID